MLLVTDPNEWKHWANLGKCQKLGAYDIINPAGDIILKPGEKVEVVLKFLSMREAS